MNRVKIGLIGCGKQAPKHISGLRKVPGVELVLADADPERARELAAQEDLPWVADPLSLFRNDEIQAIDVCTPTPTHVPLIRQAMEHSKHFFCEKPLCETAEEARQIKEMAERHGLIGMVGYVYRFAPVFEVGHALFEDVSQTGQSMVLGRVISGFFRLGGRGSHHIWKHRKDSGGGAINEMLVHMIDLAIWFFGPVREAETLACELLRPKRVIQGKEETVDAEDYVVVRLKMESGVEALCQADLVTPAFTQWVEIQGENGTFMGSIQQEMPSFVYCIAEAAGYPAGKTVLNFGRHNLFEAQMAEFVRAIRTGRQPSRCTVSDSVLLLEALEKLRGGAGRRAD